ncbi:MAG TPA: FG-GAP-like repeat-containing protein [Hymenobacter sp.]|uniref:FG-GAP-like repeat-containing protein n=1 Tax=Hymenobacter sp. TaxID=1898978 RepID=UPI002D7EE137|nr:FG-GAP-like repeat-containing protein [Hymenobacter sp.]HET9501934.1 FG-GAP-like repeat-containing protein [Hymenobacter sp.]
MVSISTSATVCALLRRPAGYRYWGRLAALGGVLLSCGAQAQVAVVSRQPARHAVAAARNAAVAIGFSQPISAATAPNLRVYGSLRQGRRAGSVAGGGTATLTFAPSLGFAPGEALSVSVPATLASTTGGAVGRQVYQFTAATGGAGRGYFADTTIVANTGNRDQLLGDLDGDGDLDLVTTGALYGCRIFLNDGAGHYAFKTGLVTGQTPGGATLADVDGDGDLDLLAGDATNNTVSVCRNDGLANFTDAITGAQNAPVGSGPVAIAAGDVDNDGDLDFVTANANNSSSTIWINTGGSPLLYTYSNLVGMGAGLTSVALADVDNDGNLDLLTTNAGTSNGPLSEVHVALGSGSGFFGAYATVPVGLQPTELQLADIDGDGDLDLLTANAGAASVSVRLNNGSGTFVGTTTLALPAGSTPTGLRTGDIDADGDLDLLVAQGLGGRVYTYLNAAGTFTAQARPLRLSRRATAETVGVTLGDVDGDLDLDLITSDASGNVRLSLNVGALPPLPVPAITSLTPASGPVGASVTIAGANLTDVTGVFFNGTAAPGYVLNGLGTELTVAVPVGATTGPVTVATDAAGTATSPGPFTITIPVPVLLTGVAPARNASHVAPTSTVAATFSVPITAATAGSLRVFSSQRGRRPGSVAGGGTSTLTFAPSQPLAPGEVLSVSLPNSLQAADGNRVNQQVVQFTAAAGGVGQADFSTANAVPMVQLGKPLLGDLDNDGDLDLVVPGRSTGSVVIGLNNGAGALSISTLATGNLWLQALVLGDVNGDGDLDLLTASSTGIVRTWLNTGTGTFSAAGSASFNLTPTQLTLADLDADGDLDLLATTSDAVAVRLNNGAGTFGGSTSVSIRLSGYGATIAHLAVGDVDADGDLDLVLASSVPGYGLSGVSVQLNTGVGTFTSGQTITSIADPTQVLLGDLDRDGSLDLLVQYKEGSTPRQAIRLNNGLGTFGGIGTLRLSGAGPVLADLDADGDLDVITHNSFSLNTGAGSFSTLQPISTTSQYPGGIAVGDLDGDGDLDLLTAQESDVVTLRLNQPAPAPTLTVVAPGSGAVGSTVRLRGSYLIGTRSVAFNGTPVLSYAVRSATELLATVPAGATSGPITVTTPAGTATSATPFEVTLPISVVSVSPVRNATGAPRSAAVAVTFSQPISSATAAAMQVVGSRLRGKRPGTLAGGGTSTLTFTPAQAFAPGEEVSVSLPASLRGTASTTAVVPRVHQFVAAADGTGTGLYTSHGVANVPLTYYAVSLAVGDIDNDGDQDVISGNGNVRLNNGDGTFSATSPADLTLGGEPSQMVLTDLNADGQLDLLTSEGHVRLNAGNGTFTALPNFPSFGYDAHGLAAGDLDGDGDIDVVVPHFSSDSVYVRFNNGAGLFPTRVAAGVGVRPTSVAVGDVDHDGDLDLLVACQGWAGNNNSTVQICLNNGLGLFTRTSSVPAGDGVERLVVGDLDGDGDLDLVTNSGAVRFNDGAGNFSGTQAVPDGSNLALGDVDSDGDLDLVIALPNQSTNPASVHLNNGQGQFTASSTIDFSEIRMGLTLVDLDGDGDLDAVDSSSLNGSLQIRLNQRVAPPVLASFAPASGLVGAAVVLTGADFIGTTSVSFNGTATTNFTINTAGQLTVFVPAGATTGPISVTNPRGTGTSSASFTVLAPVAAVTLSPARNATVPGTTPVAITFNQPIPTNTAANLAVFSAQRGGRLAGPRAGAGSPTLTLTPAQPFQPGELVSVTIPAYTTANQSRVLKQVYQFRAAAGGTGRGNFTAPITTTLSSNVQGIVLGDVNNDGNQDLLVRRQGLVEVLLGNGTGAFNSASTLPLAGGYISTMTLGDLDGDGDLDLAAMTDSSRIGIRLNNGTGTFSGTLKVQVGERPLLLALADMDADGDLDLLTGNQGTTSCTTSVRFNDGAGSFSGTTSEFLSTGTNTNFGPLMLGDIDSDGDLDLLISNGGGLYQQRNDGAGRLTNKAPNSAAPGGYGQNTLADIDGDGDLDAIMTGSPVNAGGVSTVVLGLNDGAGNFTTSSFATTTSSGYLTVGDVDADNDQDIIVVGQFGSPSELWLNNGTGSFSKLLNLNFTNWLESILFSDIDNDGDLDLVSFDNGSATYSIRLNGIVPPPAIASFSPGSGLAGTSVVVTGSNFIGVTAVRFNGTAAPGFVVNSATQLTVAVPAGATTGPISIATAAATATSATPFTVLVPVTPLALLPGRNAVAAARTAAVQLTFPAAITAATAGDMRVFGNQLRGRRPGTLSGGGTATLSFAPTQSFAPGEQLSVTLPATMLTASAGAVRGQVYQFTAAAGGAGRGLSWAGTNVPVTSFATGLCTGDIDNDGDLDVLVAGMAGFNTSIGILLNNGQGQFQAAPTFTPGIYAMIGQLVLADIDGDGDLDLLISAGGSSLSVSRNNGSGTFAAPTTLPFACSRFALADMDADGDLDVVLTAAQNSPLGTGVGVAFNSGSGTFSSPTLIPSAPMPHTVALADIDSDGDLDVATASAASGIQLFLNSGTGLLSAGPVLVVPGTADGLALGNIDGDGDVDVAVSYNDSNGNGWLALFANNGSGAFARTSQAVAAGQTVGPLAFGDVDHDADLDLFVISQGTSEVSIRLNNGAGSFSGNRSEYVSNFPSQLIVGDLDSDGDLDFAITQTTSSSTSVNMRFNEGRVLATTAPAGALQAQLYPNPAHGQFVVAVPAALRPVGAAGPLQLYNSIGQLVLEQPFQLTAAGEAVVPVAQLPAGIYTLHLALRTGVSTYKVAIY